jgi:hypothetical protein
MESKVDKVDIGINGAKPSLSGTGFYDYGAAHGAGVMGSSASADVWWWIVYDGQRDMLNVWSNSISNDPEVAEWIIQDYSYVLDDAVSGVGAQAYFGFTGATNDGAGYHRVEDWELKIWEKDTYTTVFDHSFDSFGSIPSEFNPVGVTGISSGKIELTSSSTFEDGAIWYKTPLDLDITGSFRTEFAACMWDLGGVGMAFVIQPTGYSQPSQSTPSGLGYSGITANSVAIEMDSGNSGAFDPDANHVAIIRNGDHTHAPVAGIHYPVFSPAWTMNANSNRVNWVWVEYDAPSRNLRVYLHYLDTTSTPSQSSSNLVINHIFQDDLKTILGSNNAYIGFTARSGNPGQKHHIGRWRLEKSDLTATIGGMTD